MQEAASKGCNCCLINVVDQGKEGEGWGALSQAALGRSKIVATERVGKRRRDALGRAAPKGLVGAVSRLGCRGSGFGWARFSVCEGQQ